MVCLLFFIAMFRYSSTYRVTPNRRASWSLAAMLSSLWYQTVAVW